MEIVIHRGTHQIGGSCVELRNENSCILIDIGMPLDHDSSTSLEAELPQPLFNQIQRGAKRIDAILLSHAHMDHYGLACLVPEDGPIYCGAASAKLMEITAKIMPGRLLPFKPHIFQGYFRIGAFSIKPLLMDHSAFDSYGFLISAEGKTLLYTGDFRAHGRKSKIFDRLIQDPPKVDVLLIEGTLMGSHTERASLSERELENEFLRVMKETPGIVLVSVSSQNIDRLVTIYRATSRSGRRLIIDFYTAEILELMGEHANLPQSSWNDISICFPYHLFERFKKIGLNSILAKHRKNEIRWADINSIENESVMLVRPNFLINLKKYLELKEATWIFSMWNGYLESKSFTVLKTYLEKKNVRFEYLHTSGHADTKDIKKLVDALSPEILVPMHTFNPDLFRNYFKNVKVLNDCEVLSI